MVELGVVNIGGGVNVGIIVWLFVDYIDWVCWCVVFVVGVGWFFNYFDLFGIEGVVWDAVDIVNVININIVRGIGIMYINGVVSGGVIVFICKKCIYVGDVFECVGKVGCVLIFNYLFRNYCYCVGSICYWMWEFWIGRLLWCIKWRCWCFDN